MMKLVNMLAAEKGLFRYCGKEFNRLGLIDFVLHKVEKSMFV